MKRWILFLACCISMWAQAQTNQISEGRIKLGLNSGAAWQQSDVKGVFGWGTGATLEWAFLQNNTSVFGLSFRGRYLFSSTRGIDRVSRLGLLNNDALNGIAGPDYTSYSKFYHNHKTFASNLDLELMLHFNRLRAKHNIILYLFGGLGYMGYRALLDQRDGLGGLYDYSGVGNSIFTVKQDLRFLRDNTYETAAEGSGTRNWVFAPSWGVGFGFRLSPVFSMIFEHKITYPATDLLDGQQWKSDNTLSTRQDIHHYANLGLRFSMFGGDARVRTTGHVRTHQEINPPPFITINEPSIYPATAPNCQAELIFTVANITSKDQVEIRLNGRLLAQSEYTMDYSTKQFKVNKALTGESVFSIRAVNANGQDNESVQFGCSPTVYPPLITLVEPGTSVNANCTAAFKVAIKNITSPDQVEVRKNGITIGRSEYSWNSSNGMLVLNPVVITTNTIFYIKATNTGGSSSLEVKFNCSKARVLPLPEVQITNPTIDPFVSASCLETVRATLRNVKATDKIQVSINNLLLRPTQYSYNASSGVLTIPSIPVEETVLVKIMASTEGGTATDETTITCRKPVIIAPPQTPPVVTISTPSTNPYTSVSCKEQVVAFTQYVQDKSGIAVMINNAPLSPALFTFNSTTGEIRFTVTISQSALVSIQVRNAFGTASDELRMVCNPTITETQAPYVSILNPPTESYVSINCSEEIIAETRNVKTKEEIKVYWNGSQLSPTVFVFDPALQRIKVQRKFNVKSVVKITVSNRGGTSSDQVELICQPEVVVKPPSVVIQTPSSEFLVSITCKEKILAALTNVTNKSEVSVWIGDRLLASTEYILSSDLKTVSLEPIIAEEKVVRIRVSNAGGVAEDQVTIRCILPPQIVITTPATETFVSTDCRELVSASLVNVTKPAQVSVFANEIKLDPSVYVVDLEAKKLTLNYIFQQNVTLRMVVTNEAGTASDFVKLTCTPVVVPKPLPIIECINPVTKDGQMEVCSGNCDFMIKASVLNLQDVSQLKIFVNDKKLNSNLYSFSPQVGQLIISRSLTMGAKEFIRIEAKNDNGEAKEQITLTCNQKERQPRFVLLKPADKVVRTQQCSQQVQFKLENISKERCKLMLNNLIVNPDQYQWDASTLTITMLLNTSSELKLEGANECGSTSETFSLVCLPPNPEVLITSHTSSPFVSVSCSENIKATVRNIKKKEQITVMINENPLPSDQFSFNAQTQVVELKAQVAASTVVKITATNESSSATAEVTLTCKPVVLPPVVTITSPASVPYTSLSCRESIKAIVQHVQDKSQIKVNVNGKELAQELFSYSPALKEVSLETDISATTTVEIVATNEAGTASDKAMIVCKPKVNPPVVTITSPVNPMVTTECNQTVLAQVRNVTSKEQVSVKLNGVPVNSSLYTFNPTSSIVTFQTEIDKQASIEVFATNEAGTASDKVDITCKKEVVVEIPDFPENSTCPSTSPSPYVDCASCHSTEQGLSTLLVEDGKKVCITGTYTGSITIKGGMLVICGNARPSSLNFSKGVLVINGEATFANLNLNNSNCTVRNFGTLRVEGSTFNARMENYGVMHVSSDCNINSNGIFKNTGTLNVNGSVNNSKFICNSGTMNIKGNFHNNGAATLINSCKVLVAADFHNNGKIENSALIQSQGNTHINGGSDLMMMGGSRLITRSLDFNGSVTGTGGACSVISVETNTTVNGGASMSGSVYLCDANGIETNNKSNEIKSTCTCSVPASSCVPALQATAEKVLPPTVRIEQPVTTNFLASACQYQLIAAVLEVKGKDQIQVKINNREVAASAFHFDPLSHKLSVDLELEETLTQVTITATNSAGTSSDSKALRCTKPKKDDGFTFEINNGSVVPSSCFTASVKVLGCALKANGVGADYPIQLQVSLGGIWIDPFGTYAGFHASSNINDQQTHTWNSSYSIPANTPIVIKTKSFAPNSTGAPLFERSSATGGAFVKVLRNGEPVPKISGFEGQSDVEGYLKPYLADGKMKLADNQAIYLFELGTNSATSKANDMQDCVVLVTLSPSSSNDCDAGNLQQEKQKVEGQNKTKEQSIEQEKQRIEAEKKKAEEEEKKRKEEEYMNEQIEICHKPPGNPENCQTIRIPRSALRAHLAHGDHEGACTALEMELKRKKEQELQEKQREEEEEKQKEQKSLEEKRRAEEEERRRQEKELEEKRKVEEAEKKRKEEEYMNEQIEICHKPPGNPENCQTLRIPRSALKAHLAHGDHEGPCTEAEMELKRKKEQELLEKQREEEEKKQKEQQLLEEKRKAEEAERQRQQEELEEKRRKEEAERNRIEEEQRKKEQAETEEKRKAEEAERQRQQEELEEKRRKEEAERKRIEEEQRRKEQAESEEKRKAEEAERRRQEEELQRKQQAEREQQERERAERERLEKEKAERERAERERLEREKAERERQAKEEAERKQREQEEAERKRKEAEEAEKQKEPKNE
ncbi:MAG: carbohydrate-binding domain-containing protein [Cytophagaceae bacterium]|jgi:hypothetical protein|nr:carbohydrate-binding domain-containing protein [Cytophagaceae bacterium]